MEPPLVRVTSGCCEASAWAPRESDDVCSDKQVGASSAGRRLEEPTTYPGTDRGSRHTCAESGVRGGHEVVDVGARRPA